MKTWKALLLMGLLSVIALVGWAALLTFAPDWARALQRAIYVASAVAFAVILAVGLDEAFSRGRVRRAAQERLWPGLKRLAIAAPLHGQRLPLGIAVMILLALILGVGLVAIITRDAAWTAGTAAVATMIVLAYQSWQIQESTAVGVQAVVIGQAAAIEAEKARLDGKAPHIRVSMDRPDWPPSGPRFHLGVDPVQVDEGRVYRRPKNDRDRVGLWAEGRVQNEGTQTVDVELRGVRLPGVPSDTPGRSPWSEPGAFRQSLAPGATVCFRLQGDAAVEDWIDKPVVVIEGEVVADDGDDNGVRDTWSLQLTGRPLEPVPDELEAWRVPSVLPEHLPISEWVGPRQRAYWRSKTHRHQLPPAEA